MTNMIKTISVFYNSNIVLSSTKRELLILLLPNVFEK